MPVGTPRFDAKKVRQVGNMRMRKVRQAYQVRCWDNKGPVSPRAFVELVETLSEAQINHNTTWQITPQGICHPGGITYLPLDFFLEPGVQIHIPSEPVQAALARLQHLQSLANSQNVPHWTKLDRAFLPLEWFCRVRKNQRSQYPNTHSPSLTSSQVDASALNSPSKVTDISDPKPLLRKRKRADDDGLATAQTSRKRGTKNRLSHTISTAGSQAHDGGDKTDMMEPGRRQAGVVQKERATEAEDKLDHLLNRSLRNEQNYNSSMQNLMHPYLQNMTNASNAFVGRRVSDIGLRTNQFDIFSNSRTQASDYSQNNFHNRYAEHNAWTAFDSDINYTNSTNARAFDAHSTFGVRQEYPNDFASGFGLGLGLDVDISMSPAPFSGCHIGSSLNTTSPVIDNTQVPVQESFRQYHHFNIPPHGTYPASGFDYSPVPVYNSEPYIQPSDPFDPTPSLFDPPSISSSAGVTPMSLPPTTPITHYSFGSPPIALAPLTDGTVMDHTNINHTDMNHFDAEYTSADCKAADYKAADHTDADYTVPDYTVEDFINAWHTDADHTVGDHTVGDHTVGDHRATNHTDTDQRDADNIAAGHSAVDPSITLHPQSDLEEDLFPPACPDNWLQESLLWDGHTGLLSSESGEEIEPEGSPAWEKTPALTDHAEASHDVAQQPDHGLGESFPQLAYSDDWVDERMLQLLQEAIEPGQTGWLFGGEEEKGLEGI